MDTMNQAAAVTAAWTGGAADPEILDSAACIPARRCIGADTEPDEEGRTAADLGGGSGDGLQSLRDAEAAGNTFVRNRRGQDASG